MRLRAELIFVVGAALLLGMLAYGQNNDRARVSIASTFDTGPNGYRALYEVLRTAGVPVRRFERAPALLDEGTRTLVITADPSHAPDGHDVRALRRFVSSGGRLITIAGRFQSGVVVPSDRQTTYDIAANDAVALARTPDTAGVRRVRGAIAAAFPLRMRHAVALLGNSRGVVALSYRVGRGEVVAITAPALFANANLLEEDNLRFAYNLIAHHGPAAFDEYVHGYDDDLSFWAALPPAVHAAVWLVVAILLLGVIGANLPFAPLLSPSPSERDSSGYIEAVAELMRRSRMRPSNAAVVQSAILDFRTRKERG